jgi:hypothetical protein
MVWANIARYALIAVLAFILGFAINSAIGVGLGRQISFDLPGLIFVLGVYGGFHVAALSVARILSLIFSVRVRSILYLVVSIVGLLVMIYLADPIQYRGVHLFIICWGSLVFVALDYFLRAGGRHQDNALLSS